MCATFSYLSSMAFSRKTWNSATGHEPLIGTLYVHSYKLLLACARGAKLEYINRPLVEYRLGNDAFRDRGLAKRVLIDLDGYARLAEACFGTDRPRCRAALIRVLRREYPLARILRYQGVLGGDPAWPEIVARLQTDVGYSGPSLGVARLLGRFRPIVNFSFWFRDLRARRAGKRDVARAARRARARGYTPQ